MIKTREENVKRKELKTNNMIMVIIFMVKKMIIFVIKIIMKNESTK